MAKVRWMTVESPDLYKTLRKLEGNVLLARPWAEALTKSAGEIQSMAEARVPFKTGALKASIMTTIDTRPIPLWAIVAAKPPPKASRGKQFRYQWALDKSKKRTYHYRSGPKAGRRTTRWFSAILRLQRNKIRALMEKALKQIEMTWPR